MRSYRPQYLSGGELVKKVNETFIHTVVTPAVSSLFGNLVPPNAQIFTIMIGALNLAIGVSLLPGFLTRLGRTLAIRRAVTNILVVGECPA